MANVTCHIHYLESSYMKLGLVIHKYANENISITLTIAFDILQTCIWYLSLYIWNHMKGDPFGSRVVICARRLFIFHNITIMRGSRHRNLDPFPTQRTVNGTYSNTKKHRSYEMWRTISRDVYIYVKMLNTTFLSWYCRCFSFEIISEYLTSKQFCGAHLKVEFSHWCCFL